MKNRDDHVENLLITALSNSETPDPELIKTLKHKLIQEELQLNKTRLNPIKHSLKVAIASVMMLLLVSTAAFAAWYFLSPAEVADQFESPVLAEAFRSDNALLINQTQSKAGFDISLLGIVSGKGLTELDTTVDISKTYAVVAIERKENASSDMNNDDMFNLPFFVSPLINGQKPWLYNIASMNGGYSSCIVDGVLYRLIECDNLEQFADRGLVLIVSSTDFYDVNAYDYNESTGTVTPVPNYDGVNLLFDLPLDPAKADHDKAQQYLDTLWDDDSDHKDGNLPLSNESTAKNESIDIYEDSEAGLTARHFMTVESFQPWMEQQLSETQKLVDSGAYSAESMALDRQDYENILQQIKDGATLTLVEYKDGSSNFTISYPENGISVTPDTDGGILLND